MLTSTQIAAGTARLGTDHKITPVDVDKLVSAFRMFFGDLETKYQYSWGDKLTELDDDDNTKSLAGQCVGALIIMESLGFGVAAVEGGSDAIKYKEKDEYWQYVMFVHTKFYTVPLELSSYSIGRRNSGSVSSSTVGSDRVDRIQVGWSESEARRRSRRVW